MNQTSGGSLIFSLKNIPTVNLPFLTEKKSLQAYFFFGGQKEHARALLDVGGKALDLKVLGKSFLKHY